MLCPSLRFSEFVWAVVLALASLIEARLKRNENHESFQIQILFPLRLGHSILYSHPPIEDLRNQQGREWVLQIISKFCSFHIEDGIMQNVREKWPVS